MPSTALSTGQVKTTPVNASDVSNANTLAPNRVYAGEVLSAFKKKTLAERIFMSKTLTNGTSARFPVVGTGSKDEVLTHTAGKQISVNTRKADERVIQLDSVLYDSVMIDNKEGRVLDFDITSPFTESLGYSLADKLDTKLFALLRDAVVMLGVAGQGNGSWVGNTVITSGATAEDRGNAFVDAVFEARVKMSENNCPEDNILCVTTPKYFYEIARATKVLNKDFQSSNGGIDRFSTDSISVGNTTVMWSNNLTLTDNFVGYVFHGDAVGVVKLISVITESTYMPDYFGTLITARYCNGAGVLNPALVVGIRSAITALP